MVVPVVAVTRTETAVSSSSYQGCSLGFCLCWPHTRFVLRQIALSPSNVVSWLGTAAVVAGSGSSGRMNCALGTRPIKMGLRSLRTFVRSSSCAWCRFPRVPHHGVQREWCPNVVFPLCVSMHCFEPMPIGVPIKCSSCFAVTSEPPNAVESNADSKLLTSAPGRLHATASPTSNIWLSVRHVSKLLVMLWLFSHVVCGIECIAMLRVVVTV